MYPDDIHLPQFVSGNMKKKKMDPSIAKLWDQFETKIQWVMVSTFRVHFSSMKTWKEESKGERLCLLLPRVVEQVYTSSPLW